jgi:hypothetical protein
MSQTDWKPFLKAAIERNPVSLEGLKGKSADEAFQLIDAMPNDSVYDNQRLAQPDEVWNFGRGDGIEKAILMANFLHGEDKKCDLHLTVNQTDVTLQCGQTNYTFHSGKGIIKSFNCLSEP